MKNLIEKNYEVTVKRGKILPATKWHEFTDKLKEEVAELEKERSIEGISHELSDVILVCLNIAKHYGIDIEKAMHEVVERNSTRIENN
ncbi:MAG: NTP pyrophosphatase (non-canonical NTP hydrolase) [Enterobacterales bacterium]|jgi:NTP pyrophosphatase (non-canonical NTP hydrolase)